MTVAIANPSRKRKTSGKNLGRVLAELGPFNPSDLEYRDARAAWNNFRVANGYAPGAPILTDPEGNPKLDKTEEPVFGISLAPFNLSGWNVCPWSSADCRRLCLAFAGKGGMSTIEEARILKTRFLATNPQAFVTLVDRELRNAVARYKRIGFRPNILADLNWRAIAPALLEIPGVTSYDYTKDWSRHSDTDWHLTYSRSERTSDADVRSKVEQGHNVAVVFSTKRGRELPETFLGLPVIDGDTTDYRPGDPKGVIVGLRAKGKARRPEYQGGFVVPVPSQP